MVTSSGSTWDRLFDDAKDRTAKKVKAAQAAPTVPKKRPEQIMGTVERLLQEKSKRDQRLEEARQKLLKEEEVKRLHEIELARGSKWAKKKPLAAVTVVMAAKRPNTTVPTLEVRKGSHPHGTSNADRNAYEDVSLDRDVVTGPGGVPTTVMLYQRGDSLSDIRTPSHVVSVPPLRMPLRGIGDYGAPNPPNPAPVSNNYNNHNNVYDDNHLPSDDDGLSPNQNGAEEVPAQPANGNGVPAHQPGVGDYDYMAYFEHYSKEENAMDH
jgi:hypothetical protein